MEFTDIALLELAARFSFTKLSSLPSFEERLAYCKKSGLELLGEGSARTVFKVNNKLVLKLAMNQAGVEQNETEANTKNCTKAQFLFAKVLNHSPDYSWIAMELVKPLTSDAQFKKLLKIDPDLFKKTLTLWYAENIQANARHLPYEPEGYEKALKHPIVKAAIQIIKDCDLLPGDLARFSSWGVSGDGRFVLIDYGLNKTIFMKHYYS